MSRATGDVIRVADGVGLLERAIGYALGSVHAIEPAELTLPTPCRGWNLRMLLRHVSESFAALQEAVDGKVAFGSHIRLETEDPASDFRVGAVRLLGSWTRISDQDRLILVGGCEVSTSVVTAAGALEVAVHGWDIVSARGWHRPIPESLAIELLPVSRQLITDRAGLFDPPVPVDESVGPATRLLAYLGRRPQ
jgi:uncharacterized protein (TIGR03086 family)